MTTPSQQSPRGAEYIRQYAARLPLSPGVYRMLDEKGEVLYVGKARQLKKRVASYAARKGQPERILRMVARTASMEIITTRSEAEALLLEATLIKKFRPPYNILYKDDKSYPYILINTAHDFPRIHKHRGAKKQKGRYFGPFASVGALNQTLSILQRAFLLRPCSDSIFRNRTRPCLQYQIKRCSAPCVDFISREDYAALVAQAVRFLEGKSRAIQEELLAQMEIFSTRQDYEKAARNRDRIRALTQVQQEQGLGFRTLVDADVIALYREAGRACVQVFFFRGGQPFGSRSFFPSRTEGREDGEMLEAFLGQFYQKHPAPAELVLAEALPHQEILEEALCLQAERRVRLHIPKRGEKCEALRQAQANAQQTLALHLAERLSARKHLEAVAECFDLPAPPGRIEVYDNSHIMGTHAVGAMIVAGPEGFEKPSYRRFTIRHEELGNTSPLRESSKGGDDYAMLREVLTRRLSRQQREDPAHKASNWPDLLLIDGGAGHLSVALTVLEEQGINDLPVACIAKGVDRNAGREQFFLPGKAPFRLPKNTPALHYLQRLRDEAHRFAISSHRIKRAAALRSSELDNITGIGPARKKALLHHFGSAKGVETATLEEISAVPGVSRHTAQAIYDHFHTA